MGSGGLVVLDETTCMVDLAKYLHGVHPERELRQVHPLPRGHEADAGDPRGDHAPARTRSDGLDALLRFQGVMHLKELAEMIKQTSLCGLGQTAPNPVLSTLRWFRDEYEAHVFERRCPAGACKDLVGAPCQNACPVGTEVWRYVAHVARGEYEDAYRVIRSANPFPSVCARVCNHPCERLCRAGRHRRRADRRPHAQAVRRGPRVARRSSRRSSPAAPNAPKVAVIGAGPGRALDRATTSASMGFKVTVFERESRAGGMLVAGIPEYRLPRELLAEGDRRAARTRTSS